MEGVHLWRPAARGLPVATGEEPRHQEGRPGDHLFAHDPGAAHRHAGLRPHRRAPQRGLRRVQRRSLRDRINDSESKLLITADGGWRRGGVIPLKQNADDSLDGAPSVEKVVVLRRTGTADDKMVDGRDIWWHDLMEGQPMTCEPEPMDSEDMLFLLYTSGTTGKPKGIVHTSAGYLLGTMATTKWVFDIKEDDIYWCTADIGWVTGHSYIVYGPLANGATTVMYEGSPDYPDRDRFWAIVAKYAVTILYTAPTAIRTFMRWGEGYPQKHDMSSAAADGHRRRANQPGRRGSGTGSTSAGAAARWWIPGGRRRPGP